MEFHPNDLSDLDDLTEEHLGFSALSDGLGFSKNKPKGAHPAIAPESRIPSMKATDLEEDDWMDSPPGIGASSLGSGAVAAGPMRPAPGITSKPGPTLLGSPGASPSANLKLAKKVAAAPAAAAQVLAEPAAPRWLRVMAFVLDSLLILVPLALAWSFSFGSEEALRIFLQNPKAPIGLFGVIFAVYFLLSESFGGQSLAKMILGLRVVEDNKYQKPTGFNHAVARLGLFLLGGAFLGMGFLASFWDSKRRPWHDRYSGSIVRRSA